ncbi:hypothetical protein Nepgr_019868 [Nepenthes gracilis]|uniref:Uncharacterized protein n=1 Tax=Nepenthes gracilis TaxID=150966 RepID=A0AAD3XUI3_NEPGR|nr:hypothetical protein Nepgr_019868 [Nepenthes gracilis]
MLNRPFRFAGSTDSFNGVSGLCLRAKRIPHGDAYTGMTLHVLSGNRHTTACFHRCPLRRLLPQLQPPSLELMACRLPWVPDKLAVSVDLPAARPEGWSMENPNVLPADRCCVRNQTMMNISVLLQLQFF